MLAIAAAAGVSLTWLHWCAAQAAPVSVADGMSNGHAVKIITWTDAAGAPRSIHVLVDNQRITRVTYPVDGQDTADNETTEGYGIGNMVDHSGCTPTSSSYYVGVIDYHADASFAGQNHLIWHSEFSYRMCDHPDHNWRVTNEYLIANGQDDFIQTIAMDSSDLPEATQPGDDSRTPYGELDFARGPITGMGWGTQYKFKTTSPLPATGNASLANGIVVNWDWTTPNTVPYVLSWADPAHGGKVDREYGVVQNQLYAEQDMGGGFYNGGDAFSGPPPLSGTALPAVWALPTQMGGYDSNYQSGRVTWGATYGTFKNGHPNDTGTIPNMGDHFYPVNAWSWTHVLGKFTDDVVAKRVAEIEHGYSTTMTASVGTVVTKGPRGPGNFVGPTVGTMPVIDYPNPGYNFVYRSWEITAASGVAAFTLGVGAGASLQRPTLIVHGYPAAAAAISVNGKELQSGSGYFASYDAAGSRLFVTLTGTLPAGSNTIVVSAAVADPGTGGGSSTSEAGSMGVEGGTTSVEGGSAGRAGASAAPIAGAGGSSGSSSGLGGGAASAAKEASGCGCRIAGSEGRARAGASALLSLLTLSLLRRARRKLRVACPKA